MRRVLVCFVLVSIAAGCQKPCPPGYGRVGLKCQMRPLLDAGAGQDSGIGPGITINDMDATRAAGLEGGRPKEPDASADSSLGEAGQAAVSADAGTTCDPGLEPDGLGGCTDIDECVRGLDDCDQVPRACVNRSVASGVRFECSCPPGYAGAGVGPDGCADINECETKPPPCDALVACNNSVGTYSCGDCPSGYQPGAGGACVDIDECKTDNGGCDAEYFTCKNNLGAAPTCVDVDECKTSNGGCDSQYFTCKNNLGKVPTCVDIDECALNALRCGHSGTCVNTPGGGGYTCSGCAAGFKSSGGARPTCVDVDECAIDATRCGHGGSCVNVTDSGGYQCADCDSGYEPSAGPFPSCIDADECADENGGCGDPARSQCTNREGTSPTCACKRGYTGVGCQSCAVGFIANASVCLESVAPSTLFTVPGTGQKSCAYFDGSVWTWDPGCTQSYAIGSATHPYGQDAHHGRKREPSIINNGIAVFDDDTGLVWHRCAQGQVYANGGCDGGADFNITQADGTTYCDSLADGGRVWRLPSAREFLMGVSFGIGDSGWPLFYFPNRPSPNYYWSATRSADGSQEPFVLSGNDLFPYSGLSRMVRCVSGNVLPGSSFIDEGDGTITDRTTSLRWTRCPLRMLGEQAAADQSTTCANTARWNWAGSLAACEQLSFAGFNDWREPNAAELASVVDYSRAGPAMLIAAFPLSPYEEWTSTLNPARADVPVVIHTNANGSILGNAANTSFKAVRCVR